MNNTAPPQNEVKNVVNSPPSEPFVKNIEEELNETIPCGEKLISEKVSKTAQKK